MRALVHSRPGAIPASPVRAAPAMVSASPAPAHQAHSLSSIAIDAPALRPKLVVGATDDPLEREADEAADRVMRMPDSAPALSASSLELRRKCAACEEEEHVARAPLDSAAEAPSAEAPAIVHEVLRSPGQPLDPASRAFFEPRFGADFSGVRVHHDGRAAESARTVRAMAYAAGEHVVFGDAMYRPGTTRGDRLLAHELTHVLQTRAHVTAPSAAGPAGFIRRQGTPAATPAPTAITFSSADPVHVPSCGPMTATANVPGAAFSLAANPTAVDPGTTIAANGAIAIAPAQAAGQINVVATTAGGSWSQPLRIRSQPTGIASTSFVSAAATTDYGGTFNHTFISADGNVASLDNVAVGERFIGVPNPTASLPRDHGTNQSFWGHVHARHRGR